MYPKTEQYVPGSAGWIRIEYRAYWDFARFFSVRYKEHHLVFDAPFLDIPSEYSPYFIVYMRPSAEVGNWEEEYSRWKISHIVPVADITFDESRKEYISEACLNHMFINFEPPNKSA